MLFFKQNRVKAGKKKKPANMTRLFEGERLKGISTIKWGLFGKARIYAFTTRGRILRLGNWDSRIVWLDLTPGY